MDRGRSPCPGGGSGQGLENPLNHPFVLSGVTTSRVPCLPGEGGRPQACVKMLEVAVASFPQKHTHSAVHAQSRSRGTFP